jgi:uncharacterized membrane protein YkoI
LLAAGLLAAPALADTEASSSASTNSMTSSASATMTVPRPPMMPAADAVAIAVKQVPGTVLGVERETDNGIRLWQVDISTGAGVTRLYLDGHTGEVLSVKQR